MEEALKEYGFKVEWGQADAYENEPIEFTIVDGDKKVAEVWGSEPWYDVQCECNHPYECIEFGDDDEQGGCLICGAKCDWHYEDDLCDMGDEGDGYGYVIHKTQEREPHEWYSPKKIGGIIGKYLKELQERW